MDDEATSRLPAGAVFGAKVLRYRVSTITTGSVFIASNRPIKLDMLTVTYAPARSFIQVYLIRWRKGG